MDTVFVLAVMLPNRSTVCLPMMPFRLKAYRYELIFSEFTGIRCFVKVICSVLAKSNLHYFFRCVHISLFELNFSTHRIEIKSSLNFGYRTIKIVERVKE